MRDYAKHTILIRKLPRTHRPWRLYYVDGKGRPVRWTNGFNTWAEAIKHIRHYPQPLRSRASSGTAQGGSRP